MHDVNLFMNLMYWIGRRFLRTEDNHVFKREKVHMWTIQLVIQYLDIYTRGNQWNRMIFFTQLTFSSYILSTRYINVSLKSSVRSVVVLFTTYVHYSTSLVFFRKDVDNNCLKSFLLNYDCIYNEPTRVNVVFPTRPIIYEHWPETREFTTRTIELWNRSIRLSCYYKRV